MMTTTTATVTIIITAITAMNKKMWIANHHQENDVGLMVIVKQMMQAHQVWQVQQVIMMIKNNLFKVHQGCITQAELTTIESYLEDIGIDVETRRLASTSTDTFTNFYLDYTEVDIISGLQVQQSESRQNVHSNPTDDAVYNTDNMRIDDDDVDQQDVSHVLMDDELVD